MSLSAAAALGAGAQQDMFMKLFLAQLQNQDPEEPMSNAEMVTQLAQLTTLDVMNKLNLSFKDVLKVQTLLSGTALIGREVEYTEDDTVHSGKVESVAVSSDAVKLTVDGEEVDLGSITRVL